MIVAALIVVLMGIGFWWLQRCAEISEVGIEASFAPPMFPCPRCGAFPEGVLIGRFCRECDPDTYENHATRTSYFDHQFDRYEKATGRSVLQDWHAFEEWMEEHGDEPDAKTIKAFEEGKCQ